MFKTQIHTHNRILACEVYDNIIIILLLISDIFNSFVNIVAILNILIISLTIPIMLIINFIIIIIRTTQSVFLLSFPIELLITAGRGRRT